MKIRTETAEVQGNSKMNMATWRAFHHFDHPTRLSCNSGEMASSLLILSSLSWASFRNEFSKLSCLFSTTKTRVMKSSRNSSIADANDSEVLKRARRFLACSILSAFAAPISASTASRFFKESPPGPRHQLRRLRKVPISKRQTVERSPEGLQARRQSSRFGGPRLSHMEVRRSLRRTHIWRDPPTSSLAERQRPALACPDRQPAPAARTQVRHAAKLAGGDDVVKYAIAENSGRQFSAFWARELHAGSGLRGRLAAASAAIPPLPELQACCRLTRLTAYRPLHAFRIE